MARLALCLILVACNGSTKRPAPIESVSDEAAPATLRFVSHDRRGRVARAPRRRVPSRRDRDIEGSWRYRLRDRRGRLLAEGNQTAVLRLGAVFYVDGKRVP